MAVQSYSIEIKSINMYKFNALKGVLPVTPDKQSSINLIPQVQELAIYESIFEPLIRAEIAVVDYIGLFTNFPLTGEEIIIITYENIGDISVSDVPETRRFVFAIDAVEDISIENKNRATGYIIKCVSIEALANSLGTIQKSYKGNIIDTVGKVLTEHVYDRIDKFYPSYMPPNFEIEGNSTQPMTIVIPNMRPFQALDMLHKLVKSNDTSRYAYMFYQNANGFNFKTLQGMIKDTDSLALANNNKYKFLSDEISGTETSMLKNEGRVINNIKFNKRHSSIQKVATGYFNNNLFEIDIAQKAVRSTPAKREEVETIERHDFNTAAYKGWADSYVEGEEQSNRTKYAVTTRAEHDDEFPVYLSRDVWGKTLISKVALGQVDLTVVIPGTNRFSAGSMFYIEIPEFHGFENLQLDDLVAGLYLVTDVKHIIRMGGYHTTVLTINKDSYRTTPDRNSKYGN